MLQNIHDITKGWIAWTILSIIALTFALWGIQSYLDSGDGANKVAIVNGVKITQNQVNAVYERLFAQSKNPDAPKLRQQALEQLISSQVLAQAAIATDYRFSEEQAAYIIRTMPTFQADGQFSLPQFQNVLRSLLYSETGFIADLRTANLVNQPRAGLISSDFALPPETDRALELINQTRDIRYTIIPASRFLSAQPIDDNTVQAYYTANQQRFKTPEKVRIDYIELSLKGLSDKEFSDRSEQLAELTYTHPESLAAAAKALGLPIQKSEWLTRDSKEKEFAQKIITAAFSTDVLVQKNNSAVIELAPDRLMVIRVSEHQLPAIQPLEIVKKDITDELTLEAAKQKAEQAAKTMLSTPQTITWTTQQNAVARDNDKIPAAILNTAFSLPLSANMAVTLPSGDIALVSVTKITNGPTTISQGATPVERKTAQEQLIRAYGESDYMLYAQELTDKAKIERIR